jgi:transcriptional regulator with XRE-family HTH domain
MLFFGEPPYNGGMASKGRPSTKLRTALGERIMQAREQAGISQNELARMLGVTQQTVLTWERKVSTIRTDTLIKLANIFKVSADELLGLKPPKETTPKGRLQKLVQEISDMPRSQRDRLLEQFENTLAGQKAREQRKAS